MRPTSIFHFRFKGKPMSLESWKREFYPEPASQHTTDTADNVDNVDNVDMLEHALKKWRGLIPANLERHGLVSRSIPQLLEERDNPRESFSVGTTSCSMCARYYKDSEDQPDCEGCPLNAYQDGPCCYCSPNPYAEFMQRGDPQPMINALTECLKIEMEK